MIPKSFPSRRNRPRTAIAVPLLACIVALAACGDDAEKASTTDGGTVAATTVDTGADGSASLAGVCPKTIVFQADWLPSADHGEIYELTGEGATQNDDLKTYTSPLYADGVDTGVDVEIRAGGPAIGYQQAVAQLYADPSITFALVAMDQAIQNSATLPTVGVFGPRVKSPQIIMWDPVAHPDFTSIADIGATDTPVLYFGGAAYMDYLTGSGLLQKSQVDGSYDGSPAAFVASNGNIAQQGYVTAEPFQYASEFDEWLKPVKYQLIADAGFNAFPVWAVKPETLTTEADCLAALVPILQKATLQYFANPERVNTLVSKLTEDFQGAEYSKATADFAIDVTLSDGVAGNGPAGFGSMDTTVVDELIAIAGPIFSAQGAAPADGLTAEQLVTNEFVDPSITLAP